MSPIEISPTTRSPSSTGRWRNLPLVIISMMAETVSLCRQPTTLRVITSLTGPSSTLAPRSPSTRTISRSDRMPSTPPLLITSTAPILRSPRILTAAESFASGSTLRMWWPRIARTVIVVSSKGRALELARSCVVQVINQQSGADVVGGRVKRSDFTPACGLMLSRAEIRGAIPGSRSAVTANAHGSTGRGWPGNLPHSGALPSAAGVVLGQHSGHARPPKLQLAVTTLGYTVRAMAPTTLSAIPSDCSVVAEIGPGHAYAPGEAALLTEYLAR